VPGEFNIGRLLRRLAHAAPGFAAVRLQIWLHVAGWAYAGSVSLCTVSALYRR
jgi:hypothetical protein